MAKRALRMDAIDDVATVLVAVSAGDEVSVETKSGQQVDRLVSLSDIPRFHKICLKDVAKGSEVHKYGQVIGGATADIRRGEYVHVHNIESLKTGVRK